MSPRTHSSVEASIGNGIVPNTNVFVPGRRDGPLKGLSFTAKDLFNISGFVTGAGNPDWASDRGPSEAHAWAVQAMLDAGADLVGKTITDEISLGLFGENPFDGTPVNFLAPERVPGGSSSGAAAAVAHGLCDIGLSTDTAGSTRVPASFCGLWGIRTTHRRLSLNGVMVQAPDSDTIGWLASDRYAFSRASEVLLDELVVQRPAFSLLIAADAFASADPEVAGALASGIEGLKKRAKSVREVVMAPDGFEARAWAQRTLQIAEAWGTFREWIDRKNPRISYTVARILIQGSMVTQSEIDEARKIREATRDYFSKMLKKDCIACMPTTPSAAPLRGLSISASDPVRKRIVALCCHGGLAGVPQVSIPGATVAGLPVGLSIVGMCGSDALLVGIACSNGRASHE